MANVPELPPDKSSDRRGVETLVVGLASAIPLVGGVLSGALQQGLAAGQESLLRQFLEELAEAQHRLLLRLGDTELEAFLARREAAAAINQDTSIALRTPSREKHRMLSTAALSAATTSSEDPLLPFFWALVERHSPLEIRVLAALADPVNMAVACGARAAIEEAIAAEGGPELGQCLFAIVPELRHEYSTEPIEVDPDKWDPVDWIDDEDDEVDEPADPRGVADPGWLFDQIVRRLHADGLLEPDHDRDDETPLLLRESDQALETVLVLSCGDTPPLPVEPDAFEYTSHLGDRYLAFLSSEPQSVR